MTPSKPRTLLTAAALAQELGVSPRTIRTAIRRGQIPAVRIAMRTFVDPGVVDAIRAQLAGGKPADFLSCERS